MNIGIVGLGLIGGSVAKAIKRLGKDTVLGLDIDVPTVRKAKLLDAIDLELTEERIPICDMIIVALYPKDTVRWIKDNREVFAPDCVVMDCGGVKRYVCGELFPVAEEHGFCFVGVHPMAGIERWGFDSSNPAMFANASVILVPPKSIGLDTLQSVKRFWGSLGFGKVVITSAEEHDKRIAYTSQLAHVVSSAYIKSPTAVEHQGFSAGSYKDMTRVARLNENMWAELFLENGNFLLGELELLISNLLDFKAVIEADDEQGLLALLAKGRELKQQADADDIQE